MDTFYVAPVTMDDIEKLQNISRITFTQTFAQHNSLEDMEAYLNKSFARDQLLSEINNPHSEFYFALAGKEVLGYLKINTGIAQTEMKDVDALEIERIYVEKKYLGKHVGQILFNKAIDIAKSKNVNYLWLGVWEENHRALAFYTKNGFVPFDKHLFKLGNDIQTDIMMKLALQ